MSMNWMNTKFTNPIQLISVLVQIVNATTPVLPKEAHAGIAIALTALQAIVGILQAYRNPDGTPATVGYVPPPPPVGTRPLY